MRFHPNNHLGGLCLGLGLSFLALVPPAEADPLDVSGDEEVVFEVMEGGEFVSPEEEDWVQEGLDAEVRAGAGGVKLSRETSRFGRMLGIDDDEGFAVGDFDLDYHRKNYFMEFTGDNLGLDNRKIRLETGKYESFKLSAEYDQQPFQTLDRARTIFNGAGSSNLTLPQDFTRAATFTTGNITNSKDIDLSIDDRQTASFSATKTIGNHAFNVQYKRIEKEGLLALGGVVGDHPANPRSTILPLGIDFLTNEVTSSWSYDGEDAQLKLEYFGSFFENRQTVLAFENPFEDLVPFFGGIPSMIGPLPDNGLISREPDNELHRVSASGGIDLPGSTRITAVGEYSFSAQDENLLNYSVDTGSDLLPRQSAEAEIQTLHFNLRANSRPLPKLSLNAEYRFYQTINDTPQTFFQAVVNDTNGQVGIDGDRTLANLPFDYTQNQIKLESVYRVWKATYLELGYELDHYNRDKRERDETLENTFKIGARSRAGSWAQVRAKFRFSNRTGDNYNAQGTANIRHTAEHLAVATPRPSGGHLELRKFDIADRQRYRSNFNVSIFPFDSLTLGLGYQMDLNDYSDSAIGLQESFIHDITFDVDYTPSETRSYYGFFTFNRGDQLQIGRSHSFTAGTSEDVERDWELDLADNSYTVGAGMNWSFLKDNKLNLKVDYSFTQSVSEFDLSAGSDPSVANPEDPANLDSITHTITSTLEYKFTPKLTFGMTYLYENFAYRDFQQESFNALTTLETSSENLTEVLLLSDPLQEYEAHLAMIYATYRFGL